MSTPGKKSVLSTLAALLCILLYIAALAWGAARILLNYRDYNAVAENEFRDIVDRASSAAVLGFMSKPYQDVIRDSIADSQTILAIIISGSNGEVGFEKQYGTVINWTNDRPRFKTGFGISGTPFFQSVWIEGQRNTTVQGIYSLFDYNLFIQVLKDTLIIVFAVMVFAIFVLLLEINMKNLASKPAQNVFRADNAGVRENKPEEPGYAAAGTQPDFPDSEPDETDDSFSDDESENDQDGYDEDESEYRDGPVIEIPEDEPETRTVVTRDEGYPKGLYSNRGIGWESYTKERLESELHRCASLEEDLVFIVMESRKTKFGEESFKKLIAECSNFFTLRDMIFEKGEQGLALIVPALNLDQCFRKSEEFKSNIQGSLTDSSGNPPDLCIGITSRAGRLVEAERLMFEAGEALAKALSDIQFPIIAFKSDPEKYRKFISRNKTANN